MSLRILNVHNRHIGAGGMEVSFESMTRLFRSRGHHVTTLERDNADLRGLWAKLCAFGSAIYSHKAYREVRSLLERDRIDVVSVHNIYPQISVSLFDACRDAGVPAILHVQDYKLTCPTAQHLRDGKICQLCMGGNEHFCAIHNCRGSRAMSVAYAVRNAAARVSEKIVGGVSLFTCCSKFVQDLIIREGYPAERTMVLTPFFDLPDFAGRTGEGQYVAYVGRISPEKGLDVLIAAAAETGLPVRIAGDPSAMPQLVSSAPPNVQFVGKLSRLAMHQFLDASRLLVVPSVWWEAFGIVAAEAMSRELPVIASSTGGLAEVVDHEVTGLHVPMGEVSALASAMRELWDDPARRRAMGQAGRAKAERLYSPDAHYRTFLEAWRRVGLRVEPTPRATTKEEEHARDWKDRVFAQAG